MLFKNHKYCTRTSN